MAAKKSKIAVGVSCPKHLHAGSVLIARGTRLGKSGLRQRFECRPVGYDTHTFSVLVTATGTQMASYSPPPDCVRHPGSVVIRIGSYGRAGSKKQRYRCTQPGSSSHDFTPELPRGHVHVGTDQCVVCGELRGVHHGDRSAARQSSWTAQQVADVLTAVASGASYGKASRDARASAGRTTRRLSGRKKPKPGKRVSSGQLEARRFWHTAADFVEVYAPVLWAYQEDLLRARDKQLMFQALSPVTAPMSAEVSSSTEVALVIRVPTRPAVLVLDSVPVVGKRTRYATKQEWHVLAAAQVVYHDEGDMAHKSTKLRLLRAFPTADTVAWKVFLSELSPYRPDFVVSDCDSAQMNAIAALWPDVTLIPSLYQMRTNIEKAMLVAPGAWERKDKVKRPVQVLRAHLKLLRASTLAVMTPEKWGKWWDSLIAAMEGLGAPVETIIAQRRNYEHRYLTLLDVFTNHPDITLSTGGLELLLADRIKPILQRRKHSLANIERTNNLFDLVVCDDAGMFHDKAAVVQLLRDDNEQFYGWSMEPRAVADVHPITPGTPVVPQTVAGVKVPVSRVRYSSLRDVAMLRAVAEKRGLL